MSKKIFLVLMFLLAVNIAYSYELHFKDVLPGGYAEKTIEVNSSLVNTSISGEAGAWVRVAHQDYKLRISVAPPYDAAKGNYTAEVKISGQLIGKPMTTAISTSYSIPVLIEITDREIEQARMLELDVRDSEEKGPLRIYFSILNEGNLPITPKVSVDIFSYDNKKALSYNFTMPLVMATKKLEGAEMIAHNLTKGRYIANLTVLSRGLVVRNQISRFEIVEKLPEVEAEKPEAEPVQLSASFFMIVWAVIGAVIVWSVAKRRSRTG